MQKYFPDEYGTMVENADGFWYDAEEVDAEIAKLTAELAEERRRLLDANAKVSTLKAVIVTLTTDRNELQRGLNTANELLDDALDRGSGFVAELERKSKDLRAWEIDCKQARGGLDQARRERDELVKALGELSHQIEIGTYFDEHGNDAKMNQHYFDARALLARLESGR